MTTAAVHALLARARALGVALDLRDGLVWVRGPREARRQVLEAARSVKPLLLAHLRAQRAVQIGRTIAAVYARHGQVPPLESDPVLEASAVAFYEGKATLADWESVVATWERGYRP